MKYAAILILLVASATAIPIEESVTTEAVRTNDRSFIDFNFNYTMIL